MSYKFLSHTADVKFLAEAKTLSGVFEESAKALKESICEKEKIFGKKSLKIKISGINLECLLYKFLEEFLFLLDSENFILSSIEKVSIDEKNFSLTAVVKGDLAKNYKFSNDIKAVTYNEMFVRFDKKKKLWQAQIVLDA